MQRIIPSETALVLGGGGAKGAYQIGVIDALEEMGIRALRAYGTSIGALNAAMYAQGRTDEARTLWERLTMRDLIGEEDVSVAEEAEGMFDTPDRLLEFITRHAHRKGLDTAPMMQVIRRHVDESALRRSGVRFGLTATRFPKLTLAEKRLEDMEEGSLCDWLMASASCFPAFPMKSIGGEKYIDGGFCDNVPVDMAIRDGARHIIAVDIGKAPSHLHFAARPNITYIRSSQPLGGLLTFDPVRAKENRIIGYHDALRAFGRVRGTRYAFDPNDAQGLARRAEDFLSMLTRYESGMRQQSMLDRKGDAPLFDVLYQDLRPGADAVDIFLRALELCAQALSVPPAQLLTYDTMLCEIRTRLPLDKAESMLDSLLGGRIGVLFAPPQPDRKLVLACLYHILVREHAFSALAMRTLSAFPRELICALTLREIL